MKRIPILFVLALLAAGEEREERTDAVPILGFETSYTYPGGGRLVVGVLVPSPLPRVIAREMPEEKLAEFLAQEKARGDEPDTEEEELPEEEVWNGGASWTSPVRRAAREGFAVDVLAREVAADQLAGLPVLYTGSRDLTEFERRAVARYVEGGGVVCRISGRIQPAVERALRGPFVKRLAVDPAAGVSGRRDGDAIVIRFTTAPSSATVVDEDGAVLATMRDGTLTVPAPKSNLALFTHRVVARWPSGLRRGYPLASLVGFVERRLRASSHAVAGGTFAARVRYIDTVTGALTPGREETFTLRRDDRVLATATTISDEHGTVDLRLPIPEDTPPGAAVLAVGDNEFRIHIREEYRLSVVTDRALYRPNDTVHVRVLAHRYPSGRPAAGATVKLYNGEGERKVTTSRHGIASWSFPLDEAAPGPRTIVASVAQSTAKAAFKVRAFERPLFKVGLDTKRLKLRAGEEAPVVLSAHFFNGAPVVGAKVTGSRTGVIGPDGTFRFRVRAEDESVTLHVTTADGRRQAVTLPVAAAAPVVRAFTTEDLVRGFKGRVAVSVANADGPTKVWIDGRACDLVVAGDGVASYAVFPTARQLSVRTVTGSDERVFMLPVVEADFRPARRFAKVGESLRLDARGANGPLYVDVMRDGVLVRTLSTKVWNGAGRIDLALEPDLAGVLDLFAYRFADKKTEGSHARVLVRRRDALALDATPDQAVYRPGDTARVDVAVKDHEGRPAAAALGYWAVDEAILALAPLPDGRETTFDALPAGERYDTAVALGAITSGSFDQRFGIVHRESTALREQTAKAAAKRALVRVAELRKAFIAAYDKIPFTEMRAFGSFRQHVRWLASAGYLDGKLLLDPWGQPLELREDVGQVIAHWHMAGPDLVLDTDDDTAARWNCSELWHDLPGRARRFLRFATANLPRLTDQPFTSPTTNTAIGIGGGAGGAFKGRPGRRNLRARGGGGGAPPPTRRDFPPTLVFVPEILTGPDGRARLDVKLADTITDWRVRLVASSLDRGTGVGFTTLRVSQPLHLEPWIARHLTVGDVIELPVAVRNETEGAFKAEVDLQVSDHLVIVGGRTAQVAVPPRETGAHTFLLRAVKPGDAEVVVATVAGEERDRVARIVKVWPDARPIDTAVSADLALATPWAAAAAGELRLDLSSGPIADTLTGLDALIREPHG